MATKKKATRKTAKKKATKKPANTVLAAAKKILPEGVLAIPGKPSDKIVLDFDIEGDAPWPIGVAIHGMNFITYGDRKEQLGTRDVGQYGIAWSANRQGKGWGHKISILVGSKAYVLTERSEQKKDNPWDTGQALLVIE